MTIIAPTPHCIKYHFSRRTTKLLYLTEGMLLQYMLNEPMLESAAVIVLDEVHEGTKEMAMLLGFLHQILRERKHTLRVIVMR
jgi:HrpA-like RNA helicase